MQDREGLEDRSRLMRDVWDWRSSSLGESFLGQLEVLRCAMSDSYGPLPSICANDAGLHEPRSGGLSAASPSLLSQSRLISQPCLFPSLD